MEMTTEEQQAYDWALKQDFQSVATRYARILAKYIQRQETAGRDIVTTKDLEQLGKAVRRQNLTIPEWKRVVKEFAVKHGLTDREAVDLAEIAKRKFS